jgi:prepilin-type N-terminal cleavage/methylation domain-containing protein
MRRTLTLPRGLMGFTLMEVLVALAVTSVLAALVLQFLMQAHRLDSMAGRYLEEGAPASLRQMWLRDAITAAQGSTPDGLQAFEGDTARLALVGPDSIVQSGPGYGRLFLAIDQQAEGGSALSVRSDASPSSRSPQEGSSPITLLRWQETQVRFRYRDGAGAWSDAWPPPSGSSPPPPIPTAVMVEVPGRPSESIVMRLANSPRLLPPRQHTMDD